MLDNQISSIGTDDILEIDSNQSAALTTTTTVTAAGATRMITAPAAAYDSKQHVNWL